eukprot:scaffold4401_cov74-Skeletonema_dohrnii-CCMP3373.AAC.2
MEGVANKRKPYGISNDKVNRFHQRHGETVTKEVAAGTAATNSSRGRSLSTRRMSSTRSRTTSKRRNHDGKVDTRGRSTRRNKNQAPASTTDDKMRSKSCSREQRKSKAASQRRSSTQDAVRSHSSRPNGVRTGKSSAGVTDYVRSGRSRSMSSSKTEAPNQGSSAALTSAFSTHQGKASGNIKAVAAASTPRRFFVEVDENMNILKLKKVNDYSETNAIYKPVLTSGKDRTNRRRSSSFDGRQPTRDECRQNRRRSSSCEPMLTRSSALRSSLVRSSFTSRSRSGLNQSVSFSIHDESTEDTIKRVSSYSRQVPQIRDVVDFDPRLKESSSTQATSTINDDEEDSLGFLQPATFWELPTESEDANDSNLQSGVASNLAIVASVEEAEVFDQDKSELSSHANTSSRRKFFGKKSTRRTVPDNAYQHRSNREEKETSVLMTGAASCLKAQQLSATRKSKRVSRLYKMINNRHQ